MANIDYTDFDRITDTLMVLSESLMLNFTVSLSRKSKTGERMFYHFETVYGSDKYGSQLRSIKRTMNYGFVLESKKDFMSGILLKPQDVYLLCKLIESRVLPWILDSNSSAYNIKDGKIILTEFTPVSFVQEHKYIAFEPAVYEDFNGLETRGIKIEIQSGESCIISADKFIGFYYILANTDMYTAASNMCSYVKMGPYGINSLNMSGLGSEPTYKPAYTNDDWNSRAKRNSFLNDAKSKSAE